MDYDITKISFFVNSQPLDLTIPLNKQCSPESLIIPCIVMNYNVKYNNKQFTFEYWTNVNVQPFLDYFCSSKKLDQSKEYCMRVNNSILPNHALLPFLGYSCPIFIFCRDSILKFMYRNRNFNFKVSSFMLIRDVISLFYNEYISGNNDHNGMESYYFFNKGDSGWTMLKNTQPLKDLIEQSNLVLELSQLLYVSFSEKLKVYFKDRYETVGDFLKVFEQRRK